MQCNKTQHGVEGEALKLVTLHICIQWRVVVNIGPGCKMELAF